MLILSENDSNLISLYKKIVVAVDGSEPSTRAIDHAAVLAEKFNACLILVTVYQKRALPTFPAGEPDNEVILDPDIYEKYWDSIRTMYEKALLDAETKMQQDFPLVKYKTKLKEGRPSSTIIKAAEELDADLIVIGSRGRGGVTGWILGSTSRNVVEKCTKPILVIK